MKIFQFLSGGKQNINMLNKIEIKNGEKILIVAPHPDDECIGCGGILCKYANQCDVIVMTDGACCTTDVSKEVMKNTREKEFISEMQYIGVHGFKMMGFPDGGLIDNKECMVEIPFTQYDFIFLPWVDDNHPDHAATYIYAKEAINRQNAQGKVFQYEVHVPLHDVDSFIDITDFINEKEKLIQFHKSQLEYVCYDKKATSLAKYRACSDNRIEKCYETYLSTDVLSDISDEKFMAREKKLAKNQMFVDILSRWIIDIVNNEKSITSKLTDMKFSSVTIYGFSNLGKILYQLLLKYNISICEILDNRCLENSYGAHMIKAPGDGCRAVDGIIVTAIYDFEDIKKRLIDLGYTSDIISIEDII